MIKMRVVKLWAAVVAIAFLGTGCSITGPNYTASMDNVRSLRDGGDEPVRIGQFTSKIGPLTPNPLPVRGNSMKSPYNGSYADYFSEALKQEFLLAKRLSTAARTEVSGEVLKNNIDASGMSLGITEIQARFVVQRGSDVRYDQIKSVRHEFPTAFAGAIAIPRAIYEYTIAVQELLKNLYADAAFIDALKP